MIKNAPTYRIRITGLVQGVGFRPFVYRLALEHQLCGTVDNRNDGVIIRINAPLSEAEKFVHKLKANAPQAAVIENITLEKDSQTDFFHVFKIVKSNNEAIKDEITEVSPDIAVCNDCITDLKTQAHRINYAFINCTNCGPRFTIITDLPYDRPMTTMAPFEMCDLCEKEYTNVIDRRFHAQPVACNTCGPQYSLSEGNLLIQTINKLIHYAAKLIFDGKTIALKGIGGYNLICDATNDKAIEHLRKSKFRDGKPLAVMFRNIESLKEYALISDDEEKLLLSWRRPIVLLKSKNSLPRNISVGFNTIGAILPYMPFHYLFFEKLKTNAIVLTSANVAGEPIIIENKIALDAFTSKTSAVITYNRKIHNRADDSVMMVVNKVPRPIRRSRGFVPAPIRLDYDVDGILATGAELVNTFCIGRLKQAILSQHIGDLKNAEILEFYEESIKRYQQLFKFNPSLVVSDLHPDYLSSKFAQSLDIKNVRVQHHHAHMAACMAENNIDKKVIGIILDGTGLGTDGNIWGGEFLIGDFSSFERYTHFEYIPLPGGDIVTKETWRTGLSYLYHTFGDELWKLDIPFVKELDKTKSDFLIQMIQKKINCPLSSSAGRLFDAVSAITGLCKVSDFHAEAPMRLEDAIGDCVNTSDYPYSYTKVIEFKPTVKAIINDLIRGINLADIATKFHNTIIKIAMDICVKIRMKIGLNKVVLSGGSFQNVYLSTHLEQNLLKEGFEVFYHSKVPANDGGIALGQLTIAAKLRQLDNKMPTETYAFSEKKEELN